MSGVATTGWAPIDERAGLFALEKVVASGWSWRALAVRLEGGEVALVSPVRGTLERSRESLEAITWVAPLRDGIPTPANGSSCRPTVTPLRSLIGRPTFALAPNHFHFMGIAEARTPELTCVASAVARPRLTSKCGHAFEPLEALRERLPAGVTLLEPPGLKSGEVWLRAETERGVTWAVCDAFFNVNNALSGTMGLALRATGTAPGLRIGKTFDWLVLRDKRAYRRWLEERIAEDAPRVLVPSHGDVVVDDDLPERLRELASRRL